MSSTAIASLLPLGIVLPWTATAAEFQQSISTRTLNYCKVSYCEEAEITDWSCPVCTKALPDVVDVTTLVVSETEIHSMIAYDPTLESVVITFRGSSNDANWDTNYDQDLIDYPECGQQTGCKAHKGYYEAWLKNTAILDGVAGLIQKHSAKRVLFTGHSLGGAMATFAAVHLAQSENPPSIEVYHFGTPRIGNLEFAKHVVTTLPVFFRITHHRDPFVHLPDDKGYVQIPHEVFYSERTGLKIQKCNDQPTDLTTATAADMEDPDCSKKWGFNLLWTDDHLYYLDMCTNCDRRPSLNILGNYCYRVFVDADGKVDRENAVNRAMLEQYFGKDISAITNDEIANVTKKQHIKKADQINDYLIPS